MKFCIEPVAKSCDPAGEHHYVAAWTVTYAQQIIHLLGQSRIAVIKFFTQFFQRNRPILIIIFSQYVCRTNGLTCSRPLQNMALRRFQSGFHQSNVAVKYLEKITVNGNGYVP
ncbi:UNVERIFIED_ORG: hypothetical protein C7430_1248 [Pantoea agglomerans]|uniref:Uncharacterized protein n=1 Tax=Enterobacter agglomerans TaxID=549 RepID=A0ABD6XJP5_ENTAG|nr:hypothetical protein [Pantoea agglomerans]